MEIKETKTETSVLVNPKFRIIDQFVDQDGRLKANFHQSQHRQKRGE
jgi:hypothetical protein